MAELDVRMPLTPAPTVVDERAARAELRRQVADLERRLADTVCSSFPGQPVPHAVAPPRRGPRVLTLGELEGLRDALAERLHEARAELEARGVAAEAARVRLERMLLAPGEHKFAQVTREELGETGCGAYQVRPRLGIVGMLAGWWHVKLSSGCPLRWDAARAGGRRTRRRPTCPLGRLRRGARAPDARDSRSCRGPRGTRFPSASCACSSASC